jgi:hypothetical protein
MVRRHELNSPTLSSKAGTPPVSPPVGLPGQTLPAERRRLTTCRYAATTLAWQIHPTWHIKITKAGLWQPQLHAVLAACRVVWQHLPFIRALETKFLIEALSALIAVENVQPDSVNS